MTNDEAIEQLKSILETGVADADVLLYTEDYEAIDYAINALKQKPILDKIRDEIDSHCSDNRDRNDGLYIAMNIIDRYKAESEVQDEDCD